MPAVFKDSRALAIAGTEDRHQSFDYRIGTTRVICNPNGYGTAENGAIDPAGRW